MSVLLCPDADGIDHYTRPRTLCRHTKQADLAVSCWLNAQPVGAFRYLDADMVQSWETG